MNYEVLHSYRERIVDLGFLIPDLIYELNEKGFLHIVRNQIHLIKYAWVPFICLVQSLQSDENIQISKYCS